LNIQELGSLGEFVAAIATLVTLIYLALQIRQNTTSIRATTHHEVVSDITRGMEDLNRDPELVRIWYDGVIDFDGLSRLEQQRFATHGTAIVRRYENVLYQINQGVLDPNAITGIDEQMRYFFAQPGTKQWWVKARIFFGDQMRDYVESNLHALDKDA